MCGLGFSNCHIVRFCFSYTEGPGTAWRVLSFLVLQVPSVAGWHCVGGSVDLETHAVC
jgi:hypothetical protein